MHSRPGLLLLTTLLASSCAWTSAPLASPNTAATPGPVTGRVASHVTYCTPDGVPLNMNIWQPVGGTQPYPVALIVHGGAWEAGNTGPIETVSPAEDQLIQNGFVVAAIDYRLGPQYQWPAQIVDVKCAVRFLRNSAALYHLDIAQIGAWGNSAGGHLVDMLATAGPSAGFDQGEYLARSSAIQAVVDEWGPTDLTASVWDPELATKITQVFGAPPGQPSAALFSASPVNYVKASDPPFLIIHGAEDALVPLDQSFALVVKLQVACVPEQLVVSEHAGHELAPSGGDPDPSVGGVDQLIVSFFVARLANH